MKAPASSSRAAYRITHDSNPFSKYTRIAGTTIRVYSFSRVGHETRVAFAGMREPYTAAVAADDDDNPVYKIPVTTIVEKILILNERNS